MPRLTLAARVGLVAVLSLGAAWIVIVGLFTLSRQHAAAIGARPPPAQLAALTALLEQAPAAQRPDVLRSVTTDGFIARLEPGNTVGAMSRLRTLRFGERGVLDYQAALPGHAFSIRVPDEAPRLERLRLAPSSLEFRVALTTGQTLVVDTRAAVLLSVFGLPVGFGAGLFASAIALIALYATRRETKPLTRLAAAVDRIGLGATVQLPAPRRGAPEIRALVAAFDRLQQRLALVLRARMAMIGGISHDVRSFATRLRLRVEHIQDDTERERAAGDIADMIRLLDDALLASRAGAGELDEEMLDLAPFIRAELADRGMTLAVAPEAEAAIVLADRLALRRVVANLLDNAVAYGGGARVALGREPGHARLAIDDDGPGIPAEQRAILMEPFVRLEGSRSRKTGGSGLGLAISRGLLEAQGGTLALTDAPGGGTRVVVRLPLFEPG
ncbi:MAG TPA: HAMP domain-containing sensor histidine kinase [Rhodopila sp.]|uniref:sensor histidine kinase n=1 Tax=Rhodopila sp. TaxID=2480087 RepID=UPI002CEDC7CC|nr:HAMP domain-containing sensor histidine kinase [Rhodopila sp.]HVY16387.1 HAMP domain-containing sensor histidine kinase [Rhodopila sp.]